MDINFVDLPKQYEKLFESDRFKNGFMNVVQNCGFVGGRHVDDFEKSFANLCGVDHAVGVGSGTDALWLALRALDIGPGDEVLVPANTFIATAFAVTLCGADVKFVDVDPTTYVLTPEILKEAITPYTTAVMPVHLYGQPCDMEGIMEVAEEFNLKVVEDCAQAVCATINGKQVGTFGHAGCFSFYPAKNLGGMGQGGAVITNDASIARFVREVGNVGRREGSWFEYPHVGLNSRLDSVNAFFMNCILEEGLITEWTHKRIKIAQQYHGFLKQLEEVVQLPPMPTDEVVGVFHLFEIQLEDKETRDGLKAYLEEQGIGAALHYPVPCHKQPVYQAVTMGESFMISEHLADTLLSLPMHPSLTLKEVERVCNVIAGYFRG
jgi:dTDP-4-amino-4,6-dideoxygalactose transaminase